MSCLFCCDVSQEAKAKVFRDGKYHKEVIFGKRTVKDGEACALWSLGGKQRIIEGPCRQWIWRSTVRFLNRVVAHQHQYLVIQHVNGILEHVQGPKTMYVDPVKHVSINVSDSVSVDSFEVLVVYTEQALGHPAKKDLGAHTVHTSSLAACTHVQRQLVNGPTTFTPSANERIKTFDWSEFSSEDGSGKITHKKFTKLSLLQQQLYHTVADVITSDNVKIAVNLIIFYQCTDVDKMLDATNDPTGDFINAVCADIMTFASANTYQSLLEQTGKLSDSEIYPTLMQRAAEIGFCVRKVIYRGYQGTKHMQTLHEAAVKSRAELQLSEEQVAQQQRLKMAEEQSNSERAEMARRCEASNQAHEFRMEAEKQAHQLEMKNKRHQERLLQEAELHRQRMELQKDVGKAHIDHIQELKSAGVDITKYLTSQMQARAICASMGGNSAHTNAFSKPAGDLVSGIFQDLLIPDVSASEDCT